VGTATGAPVQVPNRDDSKLALSVGGFSDVLGKLGILESHFNRAVLDNDLVSLLLGPLHVHRTQARGSEVEGRAFSAEVNASSLLPQLVREYRREQVLPRVLLHVIEPPCPIHSSYYPVVMERRREDMSHPVTLIDYVDHLYAI